MFYFFFSNGTFECLAAHVVGDLMPLHMNKHQTPIKTVPFGCEMKTNFTEIMENLLQIVSVCLFIS